MAAPVSPETLASSGPPVSPVTLTDSGFPGTAGAECDSSQIPFHGVYGASAVQGWENEGTAILEDSSASPVVTLQQAQSTTASTMTTGAVNVSPPVVVHHSLHGVQAHGTASTVVGNNCTFPPAMIQHHPVSAQVESMAVGSLPASADVDDMKKKLESQKQEHQIVVASKDNRIKALEERVESYKVCVSKYEKKTYAERVKYETCESYGRQLEEELRKERERTLEMKESTKVIEALLLKYEHANAQRAEAERETAKMKEEMEKKTSTP